MAKPKTAAGLVAALIAVQLFDIAIHVGTDQVEPVRILSNLVLGGWAIATLIFALPARAALVAIALYLMLNGWFLAMHGLTNPDQGGALRVTLFVLVAVSTALALMLNRASRSA